MLSTIKRNTCLSTSSSASYSTAHTMFRYYSYSLVSKRILIIFVISTLLMCDVLCQHPHKRQPRHGKSLCHQKKTGYYVHPRDPTKYVHCIKGSAYVYFCGKGTVFLSDKELCLPVTSVHKRHRNKKNMIDDESVNELKFPKKRYNVILV